MKIRKSTSFSIVYAAWMFLRIHFNVQTKLEGDFICNDVACFQTQKYCNPSAIFYLSEMLDIEQRLLIELITEAHLVSM